MAFDEIRFPLDISYDSEGGPGFMTNIIEVDSGAEQRVSRWNQPRRKYNVAYGVKTHTQLAALIQFYIARRGPERGFRFFDFHDAQTTANGLAPEMPGSQTVAFDDVNIAVVPTGGQQSFQLIKRYTSGPSTRVRKITKPLHLPIAPDTVVIGVNGVEQTSGFSVNTATGVITITPTLTAGDTISAGCQYDVPVRFGKEVDEVLAMRIEEFGSGSAQDIPLIEIVDEGELADEFFYGGAKRIAFGDDITLSTLDGRAIALVPSIGGPLNVDLPNKTLLSGGGPWFYLVNVGTETVSVRDGNDQSLIVSLAAAGSVVIVLSVSAGGVRTWYAL